MKKPTMTLKEFDQGLRKVTGEHRDIRPFVCDGSPLECCVFIVGYNPANAIPFWDYWSVDGFNLKDWKQYYLKERKKLGKSTQWSPTRSRINRLTEKLADMDGSNGVPKIKCLETNIYSLPSKNKKSLDPSLQKSCTFKYLLKTIQPTTVIFHGVDACAYGKENLFQSSYQLIYEKHFYNLAYRLIDAHAASILSGIKT